MFNFKQAFAVLALSMAATSSFAGTLGNWDFQKGAVIQNNTNSCARAYVNGNTIEVKPRTVTRPFAVNNKKYTVTLFKGPKCGGAGLWTKTFNGVDSVWKM